MTKDTKERVQYITACVMLASGMILAFLSFFLNHYRIEETVLWYFAQTLIYAGSVFGITMYVNTTRKEIINEVDEKIRDFSKH